MKKENVFSVLVGLLLCALVSSCGGGGDNSSKIVGKYSMDGRDDYECEFSAGGKYTSSVVDESHGYAIDTPGELEVKGDVVYIKTRLTDVTARDLSGDVDEEAKESMLNSMKEVAGEMPVQERELNIVKLDGSGMTLEANGLEQVYTRIE